MKFIWIFFLLFLTRSIFLNLRWSKSYRYQSTWDDIADDIILLSSIVGEERRAKKVFHFQDQLQAENPDNKMTRRLMYYFLAIDCLIILNRDYEPLRQEARHINASTWVEFEERLKKIVRSELNYISNRK